MLDIWQGIACTLQMTWSGVQLQAAWHPSSNLHFALLTSDNTWRLYCIHDLSGPVSLAPSAPHIPCCSSVKHHINAAEILCSVLHVAVQSMFVYRISAIGQLLTWARICVVPAGCPAFHRIMWGPTHTWPPSAHDARGLPPRREQKQQKRTEEDRSSDSVEKNSALDAPRQCRSNGSSCA